MKKGASQEEIDTVIKKIKKFGFQEQINQGEDRTLIGIVGKTRKISTDIFTILPGVERVFRILKEYKLTSREFHPQSTIIEIDKVKIGGKKVVIMAGPCAVESRKQILDTAIAVKQAGASILRGGAFKPRTSPYSFRGLGKEGLELLKEARQKTGLLVVTEVMSAEEVEMVSEVADILQVGARNMYNYHLLERLGKVEKPVLLKRHFQATISEFLNSAEYILSEGNKEVILCERGIRTFDSEFTRNTLDLTSIPVLKKETHLPIIVDPSHGTGRAEYVIPMSKAAIAAGADGLIIEVHPNPAEALSDGPQSLTPEQFSEGVEELKPFIKTAGREL